MMETKLDPSSSSAEAAASLSASAAPVVSTSTSTSTATTLPLGSSSDGSQSTATPGSGGARTRTRTRTTGDHDSENREKQKEKAAHPAAAAAAAAAVAVATAGWRGKGVISSAGSVVPSSIMGSMGSMGSNPTVGNNSSPTSTTTPSHCHRAAFAFCCGGKNKNSRHSKNKKNSKNSKKNKTGGEEGAFGTSRSVWVGRLVFLCVLFAVALALGLWANSYLSSTETELARRQFESVASRAIDLAQEMTVSKHLGASNMAQIASYANPYAAAWPNVVIPAFEAISKQLIEQFQTGEVSFCPLVQPGGKEQQEFEDFAYDFYYNKRQPPFPNGTATWGSGGEIDGKPDPFVKGIVGQFTELNTTHNRYHDTTGFPRWWDSPYGVAFPLLQHDQGPFRLLMTNFHLHKPKGILLDRMMECTAERKFKEDADMDCGAITQFLWKRTSQVLHPIYPAMDPFEFTGIIQTRVPWDQLIAELFHDEVDLKGIDCVFHLNDTAFTYHVHYGNTTLVGDGALHDPTYADEAIEGVLATHVPSESGAMPYVLTLYPTDEFYDQYRTTNPAVAAWGAAAIVLLTSLIFFLYDWLVRREFHAKRQMLQAKRKFVRFISHEVRTPLNAVTMGLTLLLDDLGEAITMMETQKQQKMEQDRLSISVAKGAAGGGGLSHEHDDDDDDETTKGDDTTRTASETESSMNKTFHNISAHQYPVDTLTVEGWKGLASDVLSNAQSSVDILNDILNFDKIQMGNFKLELSVLPIWNLVAECTNEFRLQAKKKGVNLVLDYSGLDSGIDVLELTNADRTTRDDVTRRISRYMQARKFVGDRIRCCQVLRNLVSNGLKFTKDGGSLTVRASWLKPSTSNLTNRDIESHFTLNEGDVEVDYVKSGYAQIEVIDTGVGMSQDQLSKLFKDGVQFNVNELQAGQGSGLGLFISLGIVQQHGGTLEVSSEGIGHGTCFTLTLPLNYVPDLDEVDGTDHEAMEVAGVDEPERFPLRILVVDDVATNRRLLARLAQRAGHIVSEAVDGVDAVDQVKKITEEGHSFDTILCDYCMPRMDGPDAAYIMRNELGCKSFIIGITGNLYSDEKDFFIAQGADAVLPKPVDFQEIQRLWTANGVFGTEPTHVCGSY